MVDNHADFRQVFLAGDSVGENISHNVAIHIGLTNLPRVKLIGVALVHPYFGGMEDDKMWFY